MRNALLSAFVLALVTATAQAQPPWAGPAPGPYGPPAGPGLYGPGAMAGSMQCQVRCRGNVRMVCCRSGNDMSCQVKGPCRGASGPMPPAPVGPWGAPPLP